MRIVRSSPSSLERLLSRYEARELTYSERGGTFGSPPPGYHHVERRTRLGRGSAVCERVADAVLGWGLQRGAGLPLAVTEPRVVVGATAVMCAGPGPFGIVAPCRVVQVLDEPGRRGFAYGTLPDHPERGEEAFVVERGADDEVWLTITAFSRPNGRLSTLGHPVGRRVQDLVLARYVRAARRLAAAG